MFRSIIIFTLLFTIIACSAKNTKEVVQINYESSSEKISVQEANIIDDYYATLNS